MVQYNIAVVGARGVGKTSFLTRWSTGNFHSEYVPSDNFAQSIKVTTTQGPVTFNCREYTTIPKNADGIIIMFDLDDMDSYGYSVSAVEKLAKMSLPIIWVGNKCDMREKKVNYEEIGRTFHNNFKPVFKEDIMYYDVSAKSNYNFEKPFLSLLRHFTGKCDISFC